MEELKNFITYNNGMILKAIRILCKNDFTLKQIALEIKSSQSYLSEIEKSAKNPSNNFINKLNTSYGLKENSIQNILKRKCGKQGTYIDLMMFLCKEINNELS